MTYWATLWYAGAVVLSMGYEGQTLEQCERLGELMMADIVASYADPALEAELAASMFPDNQFEFSCETEQLDPNELYRE